MLHIENSARIEYYSLRLRPFRGIRGTIRCRFHALPQPVENTVLHSPLRRPLHWAYMGFYTGRYIAPHMGPCIGACIGPYIGPQPTIAECRGRVTTMRGKMFDLSSYRATSIRCRIHALPQSEEDVDAPAIRCRSPVVTSFGHFEPYAIRNMQSAI